MSRGKKSYFDRREGEEILRLWGEDLAKTMKK